MNSLSLSPVSTINVKPYSTTITTSNMLVPTVYPFLNYNVDTGINDNYFAQKQTTEYLHLRILDKWLYRDEMCNLLKYFIIKDGKVSYVSSLEEAQKNKACSDSTKDIELKSDFIEKHLFDLNEMRKILLKIVTELNIKWYELTPRESLVVDVAERNLRKRIKKIIEKNN
jgi:hypothetical protein